MYWELQASKYLFITYIWSEIDVVFFLLLSVMNESFSSFLEIFTFQINLRRKFLNLFWSKGSRLKDKNLNYKTRTNFVSKYHFLCPKIVIEKRFITYLWREVDLWYCECLYNRHIHYASFETFRTKINQLFRAFCVKSYMDF